jgi:gamma-glutamylcyclotransferase (GGCT)/AIG2-like uncharacterized protein YtfP
MSSDNKHLVFVYGSLLKDLHNHPLLVNNNATFFSKGITTNKYYLGGFAEGNYPFLTANALVEEQLNCQVMGEMYYVRLNFLLFLYYFFYN